MRRLSLLVAILAIGCQDGSFRADLGSADPQKRVRAIEFLGSQRDRTTIPQLIEALEDTEAEVRAKAAWALGMMQAKEAMSPVAALLADPVKRVRQSAAGSLLQIEEPEALPALRAALEVEKDEWVRRDVQDAIAHLEQFEGETDVGEASFR